MRLSRFVVALATLVAGAAHADGQFIPLQTPFAQATKFSQNGDYLAILAGSGAARWTRATGAEELVPALPSVMGINNAGTLAGAAGFDPDPQLPALMPVGAAAPTMLPLPADLDNANVYDVADDGSAVGLTWRTDWSASRAYYYSASQNAVLELAVDDPDEGSRGNSISADGHVIAGWNDDPSSGFRRGVVWVDGVPSYPTAVASDGETYNVGEASAVSGNGKWVVGDYYPDLEGDGAWRLDVETGELIEIPGIPFAFGVSDDGKTIVGAGSFWDFPPRAAYIWTEANGTQTLQDYLAARNISIPDGWQFEGGLTAVSGDGTMAAGWTRVGPAGLQSFVVTGLDSPLDSIFASGFDGPPPVKDPSFEKTLGAGGPNPFWESGNTNPDGGETVFYNFGWARTGGWYAEFGGFGNAETETQFFSQDVEMLSSAPAYLNYWRFAAGLPDRSAVMTVSVDGTPVQTVDFGALGAPDDDYVPVSVDIGSYADGGTHTIKFEYVYPGGGSDGGIIIDDVTIDPTSVASRAPARAATHAASTWVLPKPLR